MATGYLPESADCVIVGGGMAGFAAGLQLELWGYKPLILERHNLPGGLATSFVRGPFEFEGTLHEMMDIGRPENPGKMREFFKEAGVEVDWHQVKEAYRIVVPSEGIDARLPWGIDAMVEEIERQVPGSRESVARLMAACKDVLDSINTPGFTELSKPQLLLKHSTFVRTAGYTAAEVIRRFGVPDKAVSLLAPYWIYVGSPLSELSFTVYAYLMAMMKGLPKSGSALILRQRPWPSMPGRSMSRKTKPGLFSERSLPASKPSLAWMVLKAGRCLLR